MDQRSISYDVEEAADVAKISRAFLYALLKEGKGPVAKKLGRRTIILHDDLVAWLRAQTNYTAAA